MGLEDIELLIIREEQTVSASEQLWAYVVSLSDMVQTPLTEYQDELFAEFQQMQPNLANPKIQKEKKEQIYWRVAGKVQKLNAEIENIVTVLGAHEDGNAQDKDLIALLPKRPKNDELENRRTQIEKAVGNLASQGVDIREIMYEAHLPSFGTKEYHFEGNVLGTDVLSGKVAFAQDNYEPRQVKISNHRTKDGRRVRRR